MSETEKDPPKPELADQSTGSDPRIARITAEVTHQVITQVSRFFSGPLPPPEVLTGYNDAFPGAAERIVAMAESQSQHRQTIEKRVVDSNCRNELAGLIVGSILSAIAIVGGIYLAAHDKPLSGFGVILTDVVALAGIFIYNRQAQIKERADKLTPFKQAVTNPAKQPVS